LSQWQRPNQNPRPKPAPACSKQPAKCSRKWVSNAATIRDICQRAGANIAAVNYHFRDKETLYGEVLVYAHRAATSENIQAVAAMQSGERPPAEMRLRLFVRSFLLRAFQPGKQAWHGKLVSREMSEPTSSLDLLVQEEIRPRANFLEQTIRDLIGNDPPLDLVRRCARSVVSQWHLLSPLPADDRAAPP